VTSEVPTVPDEPNAPAVPPTGTEPVAPITDAQRSMHLVELAREIERYVAAEGWDQNPRMFALARSADLVTLEPELAEAIGPSVHDPESLTPIEQDALAPDRGLDEVLATTMWPDDVAGAALALERLVLPPSAEDTLPDDDRRALEQAASEHPERRDVRMVVVVTRDGRRMCALRLRSHDSDDDVLVGEELVPRLADALVATFA
jgi:hypothetical protein